MCEMIGISDYLDVKRGISDRLSFFIRKKLGREALVRSSIMHHMPGLDRSGSCKRRDTELSRRETLRPSFLPDGEFAPTVLYSRWLEIEVDFACRSQC